MEKINLYWPVYKNLENELSKLSEDIHFDDYQLDAYSIKIYDLLLRAVVEIEAISKELYFCNGGKATFGDDGKERPPYFDAECLNHLESLWTMSKKQVIIAAPTFYFEKDENRILTPLNNANKRGGCDWNKAYQIVKHNRTQDMTSRKNGKQPKGTLKKLIRAMAALFLLNVYFKGKSFASINHDAKSAGIDMRLGSELFSLKLFKPNRFSLNLEENNLLPEGVHEAAYIIKYSEQSYKNIIGKGHESLEKQRTFLLNSQEVHDYFSAGNTMPPDGSYITLARSVGAWLLKKTFDEKTSFDEKKKTLLSSHEYNNYFARNKHIRKEEITTDNIEQTITHVGGYSFMLKVTSFEQEYSNAIFHSTLEAVLNKNQKLYSGIA